MKMLEAVRAGDVSVRDAFEQIRDIPFKNLGFARVDHHRALRHGQPEVIFGEPKSAAQIAAIANEIVRARQNVLITRLQPDKAADVARLVEGLEYTEAARIGSVVVAPISRRPGRVAVVTAGTGDIPVAEEAAETLRMTGVEPQRLYDVGVAGIHRLLFHTADLQQADAIIVVAGMEGALASVVGGLVPCPVVAVPTSVGYGTHMGGLTPLFAMLSSCAGGVTVVNIDNGFGAAMAVFRIVQRIAPAVQQGGDTHDTRG